MQGLHQCRVQLQRRLAAGKANPPAIRPGLPDRVHNLRGAHFGKCRVVGIAEGAAEIAAAQPDEDHRRPRPVALALERIEYFVDPVH